MIKIPIPGVADLQGILRHHLGKELPSADLGPIALALAGSTGANVEKTVRDARRRARHLDRSLALSDLIAVIDEDVPRLSPHHLKRIAIHEAGHAVAAILLEVFRDVGITLFRRGDSAGTTQCEPYDEAITCDVVERRIAVALAGRAAEQVLLGEVSAGSGGSNTSDLARASRLAHSAVAQWGLSDIDELRWLALELDQLKAAHPELYAEVRKMRDAAYARALDLITQHKAETQRVADALLKRRALDHEDILELMRRRSPRKGRASPSRTGRKKSKSWTRS